MKEDLNLRPSWIQTHPSSQPKLWLKGLNIQFHKKNFKKKKQNKTWLLALKIFSSKGNVLNSEYIDNKQWK